MKIDLMIKKQHLELGVSLVLELALCVMLQLQPSIFVQTS